MERAIVLTILFLGFLSTIIVSWQRFSDVAVIQVGTVRHGLSLDNAEDVYPAGELEILTQEHQYEYDGLTYR